MRREDASRNYDRLARFYDFFDRWLSQPIAGIDALRDQTVARLELQPGDHVLDIGCGTGLNLGRLVEAVGPTGRVVGLDYSARMLQQARARVQRQGWENVQLLRGDAAELKGVPVPFDAVLSTWALGIVEDLPAALRAAIQVLRPGGRLAVLDLHRTRGSGWLRQKVVDPILHALLRWSGVDAPEDLDDERLQRRWAEGKALLRASLEDVQEVANVDGAGFLLWGRSPRAVVDTPSAGLER